MKQNQSFSANSCSQNTFSKQIQTHLSQNSRNQQIEWKVPGFNFIKKLGSGSYGTVSLFQSKRDKVRKFAVKRVKPDNNQLMFANQSKLNPEIFCHCLHVFNTSSYKFGFFEQFDQSADQMQKITSLDVEALSQTLFGAFRELFLKNKIHHDIKLPNILVRYRFGKRQFVLSDYSLSQDVQLDFEKNFYLQQIHQICYCIIQFWCKYKKRNFNWKNFYGFQSRTDPKYDCSETLGLVKLYTEEMEQQFPQISYLIDQISAWNIPELISVEILQNILAQKYDDDQKSLMLLEIIASQGSFISKAINSVEKQIKSLEKSRKKRGISYHLYYCFCGKSYQDQTSLNRHTKLKHPV